MTVDSSPPSREDPGHAWLNHSDEGYAPHDTDRLHNAAALASIHHAQALNHLRNTLQHALRHGLTPNQLAEATGHPTAYITALTREGP